MAPAVVGLILVNVNLNEEILLQSESVYLGSWSVVMRSSLIIIHKGHVVYDHDPY